MTFYGRILRIFSKEWFTISFKPVNEIFIDTSVRYQSIFGFGGAFTDAAGINIAKLSVPAQQNLIKYAIHFFPQRF